MKSSLTHTGTSQVGAAFIAAILICVVLNPLNSSTISVALPVLLHALHTNTHGITWIISGYYLGSAIAQPVMGKLGDLLGRSRFVYIGLLLMILTAILAPFSQSLPVFVFWRVIQAVGSSMIYPNAIGLLREYRTKDVGRILGWIGMVVGISLAIGPTLGGFLVDTISWHSIFWINIPLSILAMILLAITLQRPVPTSSHTSICSKSSIWALDWLGMICFTGAISAWLWWVNAAQPFTTTHVIVLVTSILLTILLIVSELHIQSPILPVRWFRHAQFSLSSILTILINLVMYCILYGLPVFLETIRKFSATQSGLILLAFAGVLTIASPLGGRIAQSHARKIPLLLAGVLLCIGTLLLCWINYLPIYALILALFFIGISFAISNVVIQQIVLESVPQKETGQASGVYTLLRYIGTIGSSVLIGSGISSSSGARNLFLALSAVSLLTLSLTFGLRNATRETVFSSGK